MAALILPLLLFYLTSSLADRIAFFVSFGCYSHNALMRDVGERFPSDNITWVQMLSFGLEPYKNIPDQWNKIVMEKVDEESRPHIRQHS